MNNSSSNPFSIPQKVSWPFRSRPLSFLAQEDDFFQEVALSHPCASQSSADALRHSNKALRSKID